MLARAIEQILHERNAQLFGDIESHRGELHGDVRLQPGVRDPVEDLQVMVTRDARFAFIRHAFSKLVQRRRDARGVERADGGERVVERLTGDEAPREGSRESVVANEPEDARLVRQVEQRRSQHQRDGISSRGPGAAAR